MTAILILLVGALIVLSIGLPLAAFALDVLSDGRLDNRF